MDRQDSSPNGSGGAKPRRGALALLILGAVCLGAVLRAGTLLPERLDLKPRTDALEYALGAASLVEQGRYVLEVGDAEYPPRYPPGFSILAAPFVAAAGGDPTVTWRAAFTFGLAAVVLLALVGWRLAGIPGAAGAALLVAVSPAAVYWSGLAMSETAALLLAALAIWATVVAAARADPRLPLALAGAAVGAGVLVRSTNVVFLLPGLCLALCMRAPARVRLQRSAALILPAAVGVATLLTYNAVTFGDPLRTGYHHWVPSLYVHYTEYLFSTSYWLEPVPTMWEHGHLYTYGMALLGLEGDLVPRALAPLLFLGLARAWFRRRVDSGARATLVIAAACIVPLTVFHLSYAFQYTRFLVPLLAPLGLLVAQGAALVFETAQRVAARFANRNGRGVESGAAAGTGTRLQRLVPPAVLAGLLLLPLGPALAHASRRLARGEPRGFALVQRLPDAARVLPPRALCIVGFPLSLARRALGRERELWLAYRDTSDRLANTILIEGVDSLDGGEPGVPWLALFGVVDEAAVEQVVGRVEDGEDVFLLWAESEGALGPGVLALRGLLEFESVLDEHPLHVERLRPRGASDTE